jgi:hypothetical protein
VGSSFVAIDGRGFWVRDGILELCLRLLALHLEEPSNAEPSASPVFRIRDGWLLASRGYFGGWVPDGLEEATGNAEGRAVVLRALGSLLGALGSAPPVLNAGILNLLGNEHVWPADVKTAALMEVAQALLDLIEGRIGTDPSNTTFMPGGHGTV